jgi:hypothetical protein
MSDDAAPPSWARALEERLGVLHAEIIALREGLRAESVVQEGLRGEITALGEGLRAESAALGEGLRAEMTALGEGLRAESAALGEGLRAEMTALGEGLRAEMVTQESLRAEMTAQGEGLRAELLSLEGRLRGEFLGMAERLRSEVLALRTQLMARMDRIQARNDALHGELLAAFARAGSAEDRARLAIQRAGDHASLIDSMGREVAALSQLVLRLSGEVAQLRGSEAWSGPPRRLRPIRREPPQPWRPGVR